MLPTSQKLGLLGFAVLTAALVTNLFILQPPPRTASLETRLKDLTGESLKTAAAPATPVSKPKKRDAKSDATDKTPALSQEVTRAIQRELKAKGYEPGPLNGELSLKTHGAILAYEADTSLSLTATPTPALLKHLILGSAAELASTPVPTSRVPTPTAIKIIQAVEAALTNQGYAPGPADGTMSSQSVRAIRKFERDHGLRETGRISGALIGKLKPSLKHG